MKKHEIIRHIFFQNGEQTIINDVKISEYIRITEFHRTIFDYMIIFRFEKNEKNKKTSSSLWIIWNKKR
jgi:hypothetical protein